MLSVAILMLLAPLISHTFTKFTKISNLANFLYCLEEF